MGSDDLTDKQRDILETKNQHPDWSNEKIGVETDSSASYVSQVVNEHEGELDDGGNGLWILIISIIIVGVIALGSGGDSSSSSLLFLFASAGWRLRLR
jgi:hypothetical protein